MDVRLIDYGTPAYHQALQLRNRLLREPLGLNLYDEDLAAEQHHWHFGMYDGLTLVGCVMAVPADGEVAKIRQMVIDSTRQGQGLGKVLLSEVESQLEAKGIRHVVLHARVAARGFYSRLGYTAAGGEFVEVGIPHVKMQKTL